MLIVLGKCIQEDEGVERVAVQPLPGAEVPAVSVPPGSR